MFADAGDEADKDEGGNSAAMALIGAAMACFGSVMALFGAAIVEIGAATEASEVLRDSLPALDEGLVPKFNDAFTAR